MMLQIDLDSLDELFTFMKAKQKGGRKKVLDQLMRKQDAHKQRICERISKHEKHLKNEMFSSVEIVNRGHSLYMHMNFTFYHWNLIDKLFFHKYNIRDIDPFTVQEMCFNVLPDGSTLMHSIYTNLNAVDYAYNLASGEEEIEGMEHFEMPFLEDFNAHTPLHKAVKSQNARVAERLLIELSSSSLNHHSMFIEDLFPKLIEMGIASFDDYLSERWFETEWTKRFERGAVNVIEECSFAVTTNSLFLHDEKEFMDKITDEEEQEIPIQVELLDMPGVFKFENESLEIYNALSETKSIELFSNAAIRALIEVRWDLVKYATLNKLFVPYIIYLAVFLIFSSVLFPASLLPTSTAMDILLCEIGKYLLIFLSLLFLSNELY